MTGKQHAVLWLGILLIFTRLFVTQQWHTIWGSLGAGQTIQGANTGGSGNPAANLLGNAAGFVKNDLSGNIGGAAKDLGKGVVNAVKGGIQFVP